MASDRRPGTEASDTEGRILEFLHAELLLLLFNGSDCLNQLFLFHPMRLHRVYLFGQLAQLRFQL